MNPASDICARLEAAFKSETEERLRAMATYICSLQTAGDGSSSDGHIESLFREVHSLKGASRAVKMTDIEALCQPFEAVLAALKQHKIRLTDGILDTFQHVVDSLEDIVAADDDQRRTGVAGLINEIKNIPRTSGNDQKETTEITGVSCKSAVPPAAKRSEMVRNTFRLETEQRLADVVTLQTNAHDANDHLDAIQRMVRHFDCLAAASEIVGNDSFTKIAGALFRALSQSTAAKTALTEEHQQVLSRAVDFLRTAASADSVFSGREENVLAILSSIAQCHWGGGGTPDMSSPATASHPHVERLPVKPMVPTAPEPAAQAEGRSQSADESGTSDSGPTIVPDTPESFAETRIIDTASPSLRPQQVRTIRITTDKLDALLLQMEELLAVKLKIADQADDLRSIARTMDQWRKECFSTPTIRASAAQDLAADRQAPHLADGDAWANIGPGLSKFRQLQQLNSERFAAVDGSITRLAEKTERDRQGLGVMIDGYLESIKRALMLPMSSLTDAFPRMVRDLARAKNKKVNLVIRGGNLEIDKRIFDTVRDPLTHIIRNCVDHGIEDVAVRTSRGKPEKGEIAVEISQADSSRMTIVIRDDGGGIDTAAVLATAIENGVVSPADSGALDTTAIHNLIFHSGLSTNRIITDISGRGLGMAIVREKIANIGGKADVASEPGKGSTFTLTLPMTLATFRGILVTCADALFAVPTSQTECVIRVCPGEIKRVGCTETIQFQDKTTTLHSLGAVLGLQTSGRQCGASDYITALVLRLGGNDIAFTVDSVVDEQEILVKNLGKQLYRVRNIAGATILASGRIVPIINVSDLFTSAINLGAASRAMPEADEKRKKSVLVVEDSITSRTLLTSILQSAGYEVTTAADGLEGYRIVQNDSFDIVVTDVEMPAMNGFELTEQIRKTEGISDVPVVIVTSLASREDRERGVDVGANAYIVKSCFDQNNLLEVLERLV